MAPSNLTTSLNRTLAYDKKLMCLPIETYFLNLPRNINYDRFLVFIVVLNVVLSVLGIFSNFVVIYTISRTAILRTPANILILGLAISNFGIAFLYQPFYMVYKYGEYSRDVGLYCTSGIVQMAAGTTFAWITYVTLLAITADRFLAVQIHMRYQELVTNKRYGILLASIWVSSSIACVLRMLMSYDKIVLSIAIILFVSSFLLNIFFLLKIYRVIHRHSVQIRAQQESVQQSSFNMSSYKKSVNTMLYITGTFLICFIPLCGSLLVFTVIRKHTLPMRILFTTTEAIALFNGILNSFVYCWRIQEIRNHVLRILKLRD